MTPEEVPMFTFQVAVEIDRSVDDVFAYATDPTALPTWQTNTVAVEVEGGPGLGLGARLHEVHQAPGGRQLHSVVEVTRYEPPTAFELCIVEGALPVDGLFVLEPTDSGGTRLVLLGTGRPDGLARVAQPLLKRFVRRQFATNLRTLKQVMEAGEAPVVSRAAGAGQPS
jgi:uncharacterized protein YndB with AHSA1/START domain